MTKKVLKHAKVARDSTQFKREGLSLGSRVRGLRNTKGWTLEEAGLHMNMVYWIRRGGVGCAVECVNVCAQLCVQTTVFPGSDDDMTSKQGVHAKLHAICQGCTCRHFKHALTKRISKKTERALVAF